MYGCELDCEESWAPKNCCFWTVVLEKTLESPLDCKEIQPVYLKGDQSWVFIGRTDAEAETPILWSPDAENWLIWKSPGARKDWGQEEKGMTEDEMVGWHHQHNGQHGFSCTLGVDDGQGGLACCVLFGLKEWNTSEQLNLTETLPLIRIFLKLRWFSCGGKWLGSWTMNRISYPTRNLRISYAGIARLVIHYDLFHKNLTSR